MVLARGDGVGLASGLVAVVPAGDEAVLVAEVPRGGELAAVAALAAEALDAVAAADELLGGKPGVGGRLVGDAVPVGHRLSGGDGPAGAAGGLVPNVLEGGAVGKGGPAVKVVGEGHASGEGGGLHGELHRVSGLGLDTKELLHGGKVPVGKLVVVVS